MIRLNVYVLRQLAVGTLLVSAGLACILWLTQSLRFVELIVKKGLSVAGFVELTVLLLPNFMVVILPISLFAVVLFTYNRLIVDRELMVLRSAGVGNWGLASPAMVLSLLLFVFGFVLSLQIVPTSVARFREMQWSIRSDLSRVLLQEGMFTEISAGVTVYVRERSAEGELQGIIVHDKRDPKKIVTVMAERGALVSSGDTPHVLMVNGHQQQVEPGSGRLELLYFDRHTFEMGKMDGGDEDRFRDARERSLNELFTLGEEDSLSAVDVRRFRVEGHQRLALPFYFPGFALIAVVALLTGSFNRRGQMNRILMAIGVMVLIQAMAVGWSNLATKHTAVMPMIYVNAILPIVGGLFFLLRSPSPRRAQSWRPRASAALLAVLAVLVWGAGDALAQAAKPVAKKKSATVEKTVEVAPPELTADQLTHDRDLGVVTAAGNVEVAYQGRHLRADSLTYDMNADRVTAIGGVVLKHGDGSVTFADRVELTGDLAEGIMHNIRTRLPDYQARRAAVITSARAERLDGNNTVMEEATYTACKPCETDPNGPPLWQVKAKKVRHDQENRKIVYNDAWLEFSGVPVAYTPYLSHPDPTVKRESGFLAPSWGTGKNLGAAITTPYFWAIAPDRDVTIRPTITSDENAILDLEYNQAFHKGEMMLNGSGTMDSTNTFRGHFLGSGEYEFDKKWRGKLDIHRSSDDTYLRKYGYTAPRFLESRGVVEGLSGRNYAAAQVFSFQGQRASDDPGLTPLILPLFDYNYVGNPDSKGAFWSFDGNAMSLYRGQGIDTRRVSSRVAWNMPYTSTWGEVYSVKASVRGDGYNVADVPLAGRTERYAGSSGRLYPLVSMDWRYPMVKSSDDGKSQQTLEPIVVGAVSTNGQNSDKIPNEDSRDFEFDDTNVFSPNRFTGLDRVESGPRVAYGMNWTRFDEKLGSTEAMLGQAYRLHKDATFAPESGLDQNFSDYVGRVAARPSGNLGMTYRFRLDRASLGARRNELESTLGPKSLNLTANYLYVNQNRAQDATAEFGDREELTLALSSAMTQYWSGQIATRNDLTQDGGPLAAGLRAVYDDECMTFTADMTRNYTYDRDFKSGVTMMFRVMLKTLGEVQTSTQGLVP